MFSTFNNHIAKCCYALLFLVLTPPIYAMQQTAAANPEREAALKLLQEKQYAEAIKAWRTFLSDSKHQKDAEAWWYLGTALYRNKEIEAAKDTLKKAVKLNAKSENIRVSYATVLYADKKFKDAEKEVKEILKLNANNYDALYLRASLHYNKGEFAKSLQDIDSILKATPKFVPIYLLKAQAMIGQLYTSSSELKLDFPPAWKATFVEAAQYMENYLERNPSAPDAEFWHERIKALRFYSGNENPLGCEKSSMTVRPVITYQEKAKYTDEARYGGLQGTIRLRGIFDVDGTIKHIMPMNYLGGGLSVEAVKAMQKIRFRPAMKDGKPVCVAMIVEFGFNLM
ncbi:MAG TPA: tetratricopeptide repeat protein [Blastocatellia bacterium]|nr:tetratricopeptide repeat protein [Blastocatellia bacterium]